MNYWAILSCGLVGMGIVFFVVPLVLKAARVTKLFQRGEDLREGVERGDG